MAISDEDLEHLNRCVELARAALATGDEPFGSVLVGADRRTLFEDHNRVADGPYGGDATRHPEFAIARWAAANMPAGQRSGATVYTSGEHCPMCGAAHAWVGLGRIVYAASSAQLTGWLADWGTAPPPVAALPITTVAAGTVIDGPAQELDDTMKALYQEKSQA